MFVKLEDIFGPLNESVRTPSDAAKAISKFFKVAIKPTGTPDVFEVSGRDRTKLNDIKEGEIIDGNLMIDSIEDDHYAVSIEIRKSGASRGVKVRFTDEPEMFESEIPEYTQISEINEGMPSKGEALKDAQKYSKFLGIAFKESDDTWNGAGAFFEISQKGLKKAKDKIRKEQGTKQLKLGELEIFKTGSIVEKLNVDEVEIEDQEGYIRFTKGTKDIYFQADWASDDKELLNESVDRVAQDSVKAIAKGLGINAKLTDKYYHEYLLAEIKVGDRVKLAKANREGTKEFDGYKLTVLSGNKLDLEYAIINSPKGDVKVAFGDAQSIDNAVTFAMNESAENIELNEVTGLPKFKTSVPAHLK